MSYEPSVTGLIRTKADAAHVAGTWVVLQRNVPEERRKRPDDTILDCVAVLVAEASVMPAQSHDHPSHRREAIKRKLQELLP